jgi:hypothetical protein
MSFSKLHEALEDNGLPLSLRSGRTGRLSHYKFRINHHLLYRPMFPCGCDLPHYRLRRQHTHVPQRLPHGGQTWVLECR